MPKRPPRKPVKIRGIETAFRKIFGRKAKPPQGRLFLSQKYSGYFGAWHRETPSQGKELVFSLNALREHRGFVEGSQRWGFAHPHSICQTVLWFFPEKKCAIIVVIQPTADLKTTRTPARVRSGYRYAEIATTIAAMEYCRRKNVKVFSVHPDNYRALHDHTSRMTSNIPENFKKTIENSSKALGMKWKEFTPDKKNFLYEQGTFFGYKLLELVAE